MHKTKVDFYGKKVLFIFGNNFSKSDDKCKYFGISFKTSVKI